MPPTSRRHDSLQAKTDSRTGTWEAVPEELRIPCLTVLWHPNPQRIGENAPVTDLTERKVSISRLAPDFVQQRSPTPRPLASRHLSRTPIELQPDGEALLVRRLVGSSHLKVNGEEVVDELRCALETLQKGIVLELARCVVLLLQTRPLIGQPLPSLGLIGEDASIASLRQEITRIADLDVSVLIRGETGTGKELVAQALHRTSRRRQGPFVAVNMAAIPPSLAAAELFGASRGAFTGADRGRSGYFAQARGGTLFLDEIGETPPEVQVLLLRALECGEIQPLGSSTPQKVDLRLITATDANLELAVREGRFRAPLLHRLAAYPLYISPLRQRREDLGRLLLHFLQHELDELGESHRLTALVGASSLIKMVAALTSFDWPGNVRQLRNVARRVAIASRGETTLPTSTALTLIQELEEDSQQGLATPDPSPMPATPECPELPSQEPPRLRNPKEIDRQELLQMWRHHSFSPQATADALRISRPALYRLIDDHPEIQKASDLGRDTLLEALQRHAGDLAAVARGLEVSHRSLRRRLTALGMEMEGS